MEDPELTCPKCDGELELGFVVDPSIGMVKPGLWVEGTAELNLMRGTTLTGKRSYGIDAYRCVRCGYLELYAGLEGD